jgi:hypothetical protein
MTATISKWSVLQHTGHRRENDAPVRAGCALNGGMNLGREIQAEAGFARFIPFDGFVQFHLGVRVERGC